MEQSFHHGISGLISLHKGLCKNRVPNACMDAGTAALRDFVYKFGKGESNKFVRHHNVVDEIATMCWTED
ncbi:unnamed protein product [Allacma fusca]|uniref:Uncharacterized protein n=1 Tax=Allacma fusca TaxID=39272 RepID=A0A8J2KAP0_9HEXA|nr:unnamed protein product [Allacma fusca]